MLTHVGTQIYRLVGAQSTLSGWCAGTSTLKVRWCASTLYVSALACCHVVHVDTNDIHDMRFSKLIENQFYVV